jgi:hypothetical protein
LGFSPAYTSSFWDTQGFTASTAEAMITAGNTRSANIPILKLAPREKKNRIKKKSRRGFKLSAIKGDRACSQGDARDEGTDFMR